MRALVHRTWWDLIAGVIGVGAAALMGAVVGGLAMLFGFPVFLLGEVVSLRFRDDLGTRGDPIEFYLSVVGLRVWVIVGTLTAVGILGHHLRADRERTQDPPTPTPRG